MTEFAKPSSDNNEESEQLVHSNGGDYNNHVNGISNGHSSSEGREEKHKSSSSSHKSSKDKDRHRDHHRSSSSSHHHKSSKSSHRDKDKSHHSSSSSSKDKDKSKEHRSSDEKKKEHKSSSSSSSHHKSSSHKSRDRDKEREREKDREKNRDKDKDRERSDKKEKSHHHKSSSSSKDHHKSRDESSKSSKEHKSSSSHSSSKKREHKDKEHRHKDRHKSSSSGGDQNNREARNEESSPVLTNGNHSDSAMDGNTSDNRIDSSSNNIQINQSFNCPPVNVKMERMDISQASSCDYSMSQFRSDEPDFTMKQEEPESENEENGMNEEEEDDEEDVPLFKRKKVEKKPVKEEIKEEPMDDEDDIPLTARKKVSKKEEKKAKKKKHQELDEDEDDYDEKPKKKKVKKEKTQIKQEIKTEESPTKGRKKKPEDEAEVWKWWEEEKRDDGVKWNFLEHKGPVFAPDYIPLPSNIRFEYDGVAVKLSQDAEEVAGFYAKMLEHDYTTKKAFNDNFFKDWRKSMTSKERELIKDISRCNFKHMHKYFQEQSEKNKSRTKEEKLKLKEENERMIKEYGFCSIDGHKEKIGNFKIEPPGLFRGRGEHPKMGMVKRRVMPEDITLNCSKDSNWPKAPSGRKWKEVRHDNTVTWLASWIENVQGQVKYIMLNPSSKLKGEKDWQKYETARRLDKQIDKIRNTYRDEWKSKEMRIRQRAVALYFIDKLALRAGNEKDEDQADTVGCCSLRVEHIQLHKELNGKENVVVFDFLGKDSIRYYNEVEVEKRVFKNLELFRENKKDGDDLFDRLNTVVLNEHLRDLMEGLTAKVFRTYNASITLQRQLDELTEPDASIPEKLLQYNRANRAVAILCNHQRSVPKSHSKSMENLKEKIRAKRELIEDAEVEYKDLQRAAKRGSAKEKIMADKKKKTLDRLKEQLQKLEIQETDKDENKTIALGTSKLNYLDPRISVAWCKKYGVPIDKIFNKTQRDKFRWAIDMAGPEYRF